MFNWMARRATEIAIAIIIVAALIWLVVTQPVSAPEKQVESLKLDTAALDNTMRTLGEFKGAAIQDTSQVSAVTQAADYLINELKPLGLMESQGYSSNLQMIRLNFGGSGTAPDLSLVVHHVIAPVTSWEGAKALAGLLELVRTVSAEAELKSHIELLIYLHQVETLAATVSQASKVHVDEIVRDNRKPKLMLVWMPGVLLPEIASQASLWGFLELVAPQQDAPAALYSRLQDYEWLRETKLDFKRSGIMDVQSLTVSSSFPKVKRFPLNGYWEKSIPAMLLTSSLVSTNSNYQDLLRLMTALSLLIKKTNSANGE